MKTILMLLAHLFILLTVFEDGSGFLLLAGHRIFEFCLPLALCQ